MAAADTAEALLPLGGMACVGVRSFGRWSATAFGFCSFIVFFLPPLRLLLCNDSSVAFDCFTVCGLHVGVLGQPRKKKKKRFVVSGGCICVILFHSSLLESFSSHRRIIIPTPPLDYHCLCYCFCFCFCAYR